jgi:uncharacterized membrane-anchored protein
MMNPAAVLARVPKIVLFGAAGLIQMALIAVMVVDRVNILRSGTDVTLQTRPVDPRDFLRGDYVILNYDISSVPAGALTAQRGTTVYVKLAPNPEGFYQAVSAHASLVEVASPEVLIRGRVAGSGSNLQVRYGIERYFVPEGEGRKLESARNERKLTVVVAVTPGGRAAIKRLLIDGEAVYDEPWF